MYGSGLNYQDWYTFCYILLLFIHAEHLGDIEIAEVAEHLSNHPFMEAIKAFKETGKDEFLDKAGKCLIPSSKEPFDWYLAVTKS